MDEDLGQATVVYENPEDEAPIERTLPNEDVAYFQDHWLLKIDERDGEDVVRRVPAHRVYHVERTVEEFEEEVATLRNQIESFADDLRTTLLGGSDEDRRERRSVGSTTGSEGTTTGDHDGNDEGQSRDVTEAQRNGR